MANLSEDLVKALRNALQNFENQCAASQFLPVPFSTRMGRRGGAAGRIP
jgi:hypothetical protein